MNFLHRGDYVRNMDNAGGWLARGTYDLYLQFPLQDNPFFKIAEHLYLAPAGCVQVSVNSVWIRSGAGLEGRLLVVFPRHGALSLLTQFIRRSLDLRLRFTFMMGYGSGLAIPAGLSTDFLHQIGGTIKPLSLMASMSRWAIFDSLLVAFGVICVLFYFFFSVEHKGAVKKISNISIYFLMIYFGAAFGNTVMARFSLLYGRFDDLYVLGGLFIRHASIVAAW